MSTQLKFRRGNTTQTNAFTGALAEVTVDTDKHVVVVHDGSTPGGFPAATLSFVQAAFDTANTANAGGGAAGELTLAAFAQANAAFETANSGAVTANTAWNTANNKVSKNGDTITGSLIVTDNVSANVIIANKQFYSGAATLLATPLPNLIAQFTDSSSNYVQVNAQNIDPLGSADYVVTADIGNDTQFYIDMGILNSNYDNQNPYNSLGTAANKLDGYLYVHGNDGQLGGNLIIGVTAATSGQQIRFVVGGVEQTNVVASIDSSNTIFNNNVIPGVANTYFLGSQDLPWHSLWLGPSSLHIGTATISQNTITGDLVITGPKNIIFANTSVPSISDISNTANVSFVQANAAFEVANSSGIYANGAFVEANASFLHANAAFAAANNVAPQVQPAFDTANSASLYANGAFVQANAAFAAANNVAPQVQPAFDTANSASLYANGAFVQANSGFEVANSAATYANGAFVQANAAFIVANNSLNVTTGGTVTGDVTITGNLIINGTTTTVNTSTVNVTDSLIKLANNNISGDALDIGFYGQYDDGALKYTGLIRQAAGNYFLFHELENDPTGNVLSPGSLTAANTATLVANLNSYHITINGVDVESRLSASFDAANTADTKAVNSGSYANSAFTVANGAFVQANAAFAVANSSALYANGAFTEANAAFEVANSASVYANGAFTQANTKVSKSGDTITGVLEIANTTGSSSNSTGALTVQGGVGIKGSIYADSVYDSGRRVLTVADAAFESGNSGQAAAVVASYYANLAFEQANSAALYANGAFVQANAAFLQANTPSHVANSAASYANGAFVQANAAFGVSNSASLYANGAFLQANAAFIVANNALNVTTGGTVTGDVSITGNLLVNGTTTYINTSVIATQDSLIKLANNNTVGDTLDIGFYGQSNTGTLTYTGLVKQAGTNNYLLFKGLTNDPSSNTLSPGSATAANVATLIANVSGYSITSNGVDLFAYTTNAYTQANTATNNAAGSSLYANGAFVQANAAFDQANTANSNAATADSKAVTAGSYANSAFIAANSAFLAANTPSNVANSAALYANGAFIQANAAFVKANTPSDVANSASLYANGAFVQANAAFLQANTPSNVANSAALYANGAFVQANAAFLQANTPSNVANSAALYANGAFVQANAAFLQANTPSYVANSAALYANGAFAQANAAYNKANTSLQNTGINSITSGSLAITNTGGTGLTVTGNVIFNNDLTVSGNLVIGGNTTTISANNLIIDDSIIYLANNSVANTLDIGVVGNFTQGYYQHTGIVRDHTDGVWKFFSNVISEPTTTVDFTNAVYETIKTGGVSISGISLDESANVTVPTTSATTVYSFNSVSYTTAKLIVQMKYGSSYHSAELFLLQDGSTAYLTQYAELITGSSLGSIDATISGGKVNIQVTASNASTNVKINAKLISA